MSPNQQRQITKGKNFTVQVINVLLRSSSLLDVMHRCWNFKRESTSAILSMSSLKSIDDETTDILKVSAVLDTSKFDSSNDYTWRTGKASPWQRLASWQWVDLIRTFRRRLARSCKTGRFYRTKSTKYKISRINRSQSTACHYSSCARSVNKNVEVDKTADISLTLR